MWTKSGNSTGGIPTVWLVYHLQPRLLSMGRHGVYSIDAIRSGPAGRWMMQDTPYVLPGTRVTTRLSFKEIGARLGSSDVGLIPIGAYEPRWFMKDMHVNPEEAVKLHLDSRSKQSFAMHWGTFPLTAEPPGSPPLQLAKALTRAQVPPSHFSVLDIGETRSMS